MPQARGLRHGRLLAGRCPHCGQRPASRPLSSWAGHCGGPHGCGGRLDAASAPRYLYELLTGCGLGTALPPYRLSAGSLGSYHDFVLGMPASLATALALAPPGDLPVTNPQHADERGRRAASVTGSRLLTARGC